MNKNIKRLSVLLLSLLFAIGSVMGIAPQQTFATALENAVTVRAIDIEGNEVLPLTAVSVEPGDNAYEVLIAAADQQEIEVISEESDWGEMINQIGDTKATNPYYWSFITQGKPADVGVSGYSVKNGDNLAFVVASFPEEENLPNVSVTVSVTSSEGNSLFKATTVELTGGSSAYDAIYQAAKANEVELEVTVDNQYFALIDNVGNQDLNDTDYWNLVVNGEDSMNGVSTTFLNDGDHVELAVKSSVIADPEAEEPTDTDIPEDEESIEPPVTEPVNPAPTDPEKTDQIEKPQVDVPTQIQGILNYINQKNISLEYFSEWWIWSLSHVSFDVPTSYIESLEAVVKENDGVFSGLELQKIIIALSLQGKDATNFAGYNLVENMLEKKRNLINDYIYTLLAIDSNGYEVAEGTKEGLIDAILAEEKENGGWALFGDTAGADITGMALSALAPYRNNQEVGASINRAVGVLSVMQEENGGFFDTWNGGDSSESISQAIIGLVSVGVDPTSEAFTKSGGNLIQHLAEFENEDNGYKHVLKDKRSMTMSTQQALLAYVAYDMFVKETGLVYQKPIVVENPVIPEPEVPETPEEPVVPEPEVSETPVPEVPVTPETSETETPKEPESTIIPEATEKPEITESNKTEELPETGLADNNYTVVGLLTITIGSVVFYFNRKKKTNE